LRRRYIGSARKADVAETTPAAGREHEVGKSRYESCPMQSTTILLTEGYYFLIWWK
jgi:hypothetical protein